MNINKSNIYYIFILVLLGSLILLSNYLYTTKYKNKIINENNKMIESQQKDIIEKEIKDLEEEKYSKHQIYIENIEDLNLYFSMNDILYISDKLEFFIINNIGNNYLDSRITSIDVLENKINVNVEIFNYGSIIIEIKIVNNKINDLIFLQT